MRPSGSMRAQIGTLILATSGIQLANGFFNTLISLRVAIEDFEATMAGLVLSSYFAGFTLAALRCGRVIERVGHIRAYAGFACGGLFITTESWLNAKAQPTERGRIFSIYMVGTFLALALGQLLIGPAEIETARPFNMIVAVFAIALVMVSTTRAEPRRLGLAATLPFGQLARAAPVAVAAGALSGLISSSFYTLVPAWMQDEGIARETIAISMLAAVLAGLAFQVPIGRLSDRFDRRIVLAALGLGFVGTAVALVLLPHSLPVVLPAAALLGGFMSTLYPVCVAHAHDRMPANRVVAVSSQLILASGLGSVIGPLIGTSFMARFSIDGVFYFMAAAALLLAFLAAGRSLTIPPPEHRERPFEILAPQAAPLAHDPFGSSDEPRSPDSAGVPEKSRSALHLSP